MLNVTSEDRDSVYWYNMHGFPFRRLDSVAEQFPFLRRLDSGAEQIWETFLAEEPGAPGDCPLPDPELALTIMVVRHSDGKFRVLRRVQFKSWSKWTKEMVLELPKWTTRVRAAIHIGSSYSSLARRPGTVFRVRVALTWRLEDDVPHDGFLSHQLWY